ncbi:TYR1-like protein, partial [Mya arenaria]
DAPVDQDLASEACLRVFLDSRNGDMARFGRMHGQQLLRKHKGAGFLGWHRIFLAAFEEKLREVEPGVSLPYWDYTMDSYLPRPADSLVWSPCFFGNGVGKITEGPFAGMFGGFNVDIVRDYAPGGKCPPELISKNDFDRLMKFCYFKNITTGSGPYYGNPNNLELLHDNVHDWVGGDMSQIAFSSFDPVFWMHHTYIDYVWERFRRHQKKNCKHVDVESDYRPERDLSQNNAPGHSLTSPMHGFEYLQVRQGLSNIWTSLYYDYEDHPVCPDCGNSENLYCDKTVDPTRPKGVCVTKTHFFCVQPSVQLSETLVWNPKKELDMQHQGLPGDGQTGHVGHNKSRILASELNIGYLTVPNSSKTIFQSFDSRLLVFCIVTCSVFIILLN